jgi:tripartite-type tricarboxylate transporter receptor subunit TctC
LLKHAELKGDKMKHIQRPLILVGLFLSIGVLVAPVCAQDYPAKPVRVIVPFPAGTGVDASARQIVAKLPPLMGQSVFVENRPGASGIIGTEAAAKAAPDGYTLYMGPITTVALLPYLYSKLPFNMERDFSAISQISRARVGLVVYPGLGVSNLKELIELSKKRPLAISTTGIGANGHLYGAYFASMTGANINFIHYNTSSPLQDTLSGRIDGAFDGLPPYLGSIKGGKLKLLALVGKTRHPNFADTPTFAEGGVPDFEAYGWAGFFAPTGTSQAIVERLGSVIAKAVRSQDLVDLYNSQGTDAVGNSPAEFTAFVRSEQAKWSKVIRELGVKLD